VPAAAEVGPGAGALGPGSEKGALTKGFRPFSAETRSTKLGVHRPLLRKGEGEWCSLLLKSTPGPGPKSFRPLGSVLKIARQSWGGGGRRQRASLRRGEMGYSPLER
jgi:hypothetical protein